VVSFSAVAATLGDGKAAETAVTRAMKVLADVKQIVAVDFPGGRLDSRLKRYRVADSYLRFWFRFVEPQLRNIEIGRPDLAVTAFRRSWPSWRGRAIEPIAREAVLRLAPGMAGSLATIESAAPMVGAERHVRVRPSRCRTRRTATGRGLGQMAGKPTV
jgi:uncharacterized protein